MSLIVEDGTGLATAESYISVADASAYHTARGNAAWAALASDTVREQCLRRATDYMLQAYRKRWLGYRFGATQALDWPRSFVYLEPFVHGAVGAYPYLVADNIVPDEVANACAELALRASSATLLADLTRGKKRVKVGPIETEYDTTNTQRVRYEAVDAMLAPYLARAAGGVTVVRS